jgi:hypothetical protein
MKSNHFQTKCGGGVDYLLQKHNADHLDSNENSKDR